jgi:(S)-2-hydroxyglutarate dehydrogenase
LQVAGDQFDIVVVGGGIVGLATAYQISERYPDRRIVVLEKEAELATHQTGHNSGVLHSGIYYRPGSLRAINCRAGKRAMEEFCAAHGVPYDICGKVIVATEQRELESLDRIFERGRQNEIRCEMIDADRLRELEPHVAGIRAIHVPEAGIVNFRQVAMKLGEILVQRGGEIALQARVRSIERLGGASREIRVSTWDGRQFGCQYLVNCAGLYCDRVATLSGERPPAKIVPFRGEYYDLKPEAMHLCRNLIYPVPDPSFPFLGVHFTRMIDGKVECGPNAVLAFAREGYLKRIVRPADMFDYLTHIGFLKLSAKYWRIGAGEMWRSFSKQAFVRALQRLIPEIRGDLLETGRAGVRAQAVARDGTMVDDFLIVESERMVHVCNAPSPAATSSLNIGKLVTEKLAGQIG